MVLVCAVADAQVRQRALKSARVDEGRDDAVFRSDRVDAPRGWVRAFGPTLILVPES